MLEKCPKNLAYELFYRKIGIILPFFCLSANSNFPNFSLEALGFSKFYRRFPASIM